MPGSDGFSADQPRTALRRLEDSFPAAGHVSIFHDKSPVTGRFTGCDGKIGDAAAFGVLCKMGFVLDFRSEQITVPSGMCKVSYRMPYLFHREGKIGCCPGGRHTRPHRR